MTGGPVDVLVLGLGPAGACAARYAALRGCRVVAVERKRSPGVPVQCAEFVPALVGIEVPGLAGSVRQSIAAMQTFVEEDPPDRTDPFPGLMIDRAAFDAGLVAQAQRAGADCRFGTRAAAIGRDGRVRLADGTCWAPKVIIGADGPRSIAGRAIGRANRALVETRQLTVALEGSHESTDIFLCARIPGGYGWLFPKGDVAHVGAGVDPSHKDRLKAIVDELHALLARQRPGGPRHSFAHRRRHSRGRHGASPGARWARHWCCSRATRRDSPIRSRARASPRRCFREGSRARPRRPRSKATAPRASTTKTSWMPSSARPGPAPPFAAASCWPRAATSAPLRRAWIAYPEYWEKIGDDPHFRAGSPLPQPAEMRVCLDFPAAMSCRRPEAPTTTPMASCSRAFPSRRRKNARNGARVKANAVAPEGVYLPNNNVLTPAMRSPGYVQMSTAAAITLGIMKGMMHRCECTRCLNLLLTYPEGCRANCAYCGLARHREAERDYADRNFIRVDWPAVPLAQAIDIVARDGEKSPFHRMCISMITHPHSDADTVTVLRQWTERIDPKTIPVSILSNPTTMEREDVERLHGLGADIFTVALDAATPELFDRTRGKGVQSPHSWKKYWEILMDAREIFGPRKFGAHIIVGMGETEHDVLSLVQRLVDLGGHSHLFCFFPEKGSLMDHLPATPRDQWRRVQLARYLIDYRGVRVEHMKFDGEGRVADYGLASAELRGDHRRGHRLPHLGLPGQVRRRHLRVRPAVRRFAAFQHRELSLRAESGTTSARSAGS